MTHTNMKSLCYLLNTIRYGIQMIILDVIYQNTCKRRVAVHINLSNSLTLMSFTKKYKLYSVQLFPEKI